jgi:hypothetical protein
MALPLSDFPATACRRTGPAGLFFNRGIGSFRTTRPRGDSMPFLIQSANDPVVRFKGPAGLSANGLFMLPALLTEYAAPAPVSVLRRGMVIAVYTSTIF